MEEVIRGLFGPVAAIAAFSYLRTAVIQARHGEGFGRLAGAWLATFVLGYFAVVRVLGSLGLVGSELDDELTLPMTIPVYGVHIYAAFRLAEESVTRRHIKTVLRDHEAEEGTA